MARNSRRSKGSSAYRVKRSKKKKPLRALEISIAVLFVIVVAYVASFTVQITNGYSKSSEPATMFINVQLLNGCGEKGLANRLANLVEKAVEKPLAIRIIDTDNFDNFGLEKTFIISRQENLEAAKQLADQIGIEQEVIYKPIENNYLDIGATVVLGLDYESYFPTETER
jgi:hypothetical protein